MTAVVPGTRYTKKNGALVALTGGSGGGVLDRINARFALSPTRAVRMVFTGSSTTEANPGYVTPLVAAIQAAYPSGGTEMAVRNSLTATFTAPSTAPGVQGYNAAVGGTHSGNFVTADTVSRIGALNPDVLLIMVGSNDFGIVLPPAYKANLSSKIADLKVVAPSCLFVFAHSYQRMDGNPSPATAQLWADYSKALAEVAAADPARVVALDISGLYIAAGVPLGADPANLIDTDNIHQTPTGYSLMTEAVRLALGVPKTPAAVVAPPADTTAPTVPGTPVATAGQGSATATTSGSTDTVGVTAYRWRRNGTTVVSGQTGTSMTDTGLPVGTAVFYTASALDAAGNESAQSSASNSVTPTAPSDSTAPTMPGTPTATAGVNSASVAFTDSTDAVGVTGYRVYSSADGYTAVAATGATSPITVGSLVAGTPVTFKVAAYDAAGNVSAQSAASNSVTPTAPAQAAPLASDNFDRADGPIGTAPTGQTWSGDPFTISGSRVYGGGLTSVDVGTGDVDVSVDVIYGSSASSGILFNTLDGSNRLVYYANGSAVTLAKMDAGTLTVLGSGGAGLVTTGATHTLQAVSKGAVITCYLNGAQVISYTLTAGEQTKYKSYTRVGLRHSSGTGNYLDNFVARPAP